ncbi:putative GDP-fucose protein O-fucosyltransferase [Helianthus anomalus]
MVVGTILFTSYWFAWSAREAAIEHNTLLKSTKNHLLPLKTPLIVDHRDDDYYEVFDLVITDVVVVARILNATLVVPELDHHSFWKDDSDFANMFDVD